MRAKAVYAGEVKPNPAAILGSGYFGALAPGIWASPADIRELHDTISEAKGEAIPTAATVPHCRSNRVAHSGRSGDSALGW